MSCSEGHHCMMTEEGYNQEVVSCSETVFSTMEPLKIN